MPVRPEIVDYINSHAELVISEAKEILGTITNREVALEFQGADEFTFDDLKANYPEAVVDVSFTVENDPDGIVHLFIDKATAARIGSIMMMIEEEDAEFTEEHIDAMQETSNQILSAVSTKLKESEDTAVSVQDVKGEETELNAEMFEKPDLVATKFSLKLGDDEPKTLFAVLTASTIDALGGGEVATEVAEEEGESPAEEAVSDGEPPAEGEETPEGESQSGGDVEGDEEEVAGDLDISGMLSDEEGEEEVAIGQPEEAPPQEPKSEPVIDEKFDFLMDLTFPIAIELGRTKMLIKDILELGHGSVIEFNKLAGEPVDLLIDDKKVAEGEVVVVDEHFGIKITQLIHKTEMVRELGTKRG